MKRFISIIVIAVVALGILAALFRWQLTSESNSSRASKAILPITNDLDASSSSGVSSTHKQLPGGHYEPKDPRWQWWNEQKKRDPKFEWKMPISFYGIVMDQDGTPVSSAVVKFQWNDLSRTGTSYAGIISSEDGRFSLEDVTGKVLEVRVSKEGYETLDYVRAFEYAAFFAEHFHSPDPEAPVIFRLRKKAQAEPLIVRQILYGFKIDGTPHYIDLATGKKQVGGREFGDMAIRIKRPEKPGNRFDWSISMEGIGEAGFIEVENGPMFEAPKEGYQSRIEHEFSAIESDWRASIGKRFYVRGRDGSTYARIEANIVSKYNEEAAIDLKIYLNPKSGSRNLEHDPAKASP